MTLSLENNQLTGTIPAGVAALPQLQSLRLYNNSLSGFAAAMSSCVRELEPLYHAIA